MKGAERRAAIAAYKERKTAAGVFAVRCATTGQVWVGPSPHLDTQQTGLWFALRLGGFPNPGLQSAFTAHGEAAFSFELLERLDEDLTGYLKSSALKDRTAYWRAVLNALSL